MKINENLMERALELATLGEGYTWPNPLVGCVIEKNGEIIAEGYHQRFGDDHAEVDALKKLNFKAEGATLYVNLEPCCHFGKKPPCTKFIIKSGIKRVVVSNIDPNPIVSGNGIRELKNANIEVVVGVLEEKGKKINEVYFTYMCKNRPYIVIKIASTLDGKIADRIGTSKWITNEKSRRFVHYLRSISGGVLVGINTVIKDDPYLNVRFEKVKRIHPLRIILDTNLNISFTSNIVKTAKDYQTIIFTGVENEEIKRELEKIGVEIIQVEKKDKDSLDINSVLKELRKREIWSILVEGGKTVFSSFLRERLIDQIYIFYSPKLLGDTKAYSFFEVDNFIPLNESIKFSDIEVKQFDDDILIKGRYVHRNN